MKKSIITSLLTMASVLAASAQLNGDGYYRVYNADTNRYIYVIDNKGDVNYAATTVDMEAIELWTGLDAAISDPATVLYIQKVGDKYDIRTQGTGLYQMISNYISLRPNLSDDRGTYRAYGTSNSITKYLSDVRPSYLSDPSHLNGESQKGRDWYIVPIDNNTDNYFGAKATVSCAEGHYLPFYSEFPFSLSAGMRALYISDVDYAKGIAIYKEISGVIPAATPVILQCVSNNRADNKIAFCMSGPSALADNLLKGVYFCSTVGGFHNNFVNYAPQTMRSLGVTADGRLGMIKESYSYVPRNSFYLPVTTTCPDQLVLMTQKEYESGITDITADIDADAPVYNMMGVMVRHEGEGFDGLAPGVYIRNGVKHIVR